MLVVGWLVLFVLRLSRLHLLWLFLLLLLPVGRRDGKKRMNCGTQYQFAFYVGLLRTRLQKPAAVSFGLIPKTRVQSRHHPPIQ